MGNPEKKCSSRCGRTGWEAIDQQLNLVALDQFRHNRGSDRHIAVVAEYCISWSVGSTMFSL